MTADPSTHPPLPLFQLEGLRRLQVAYDAEDDIASIHLDGPRSSVTTELDHGWFVRTADGAVTGFEMHGLRRFVLTNAAYEPVVTPALRELTSVAGCTMAEDFAVRGDVAELPRTTQLIWFILGVVAEKYTSRRRQQVGHEGVWPAGHATPGPGGVDPPARRP